MLVPSLASRQAPLQDSQGLAWATWCDHTVTGLHVCDHTVTGLDVCDHTVTGLDVCDHTVTGLDVCDHTVTGLDVFLLNSTKFQSLLFP
jgi:aromatic ring-cleaving dioxygenase